MIHRKGEVRVLVSNGIINLMTCWIAIGKRKLIDQLLTEGNNLNVRTSSSKEWFQMCFFFHPKSLCACSWLITAKQEGLCSYNNLVC